MEGDKGERLSGDRLLQIANSCKIRTVTSDTSVAYDAPWTHPAWSPGPVICPFASLPTSNQHERLSNAVRYRTEIKFVQHMSDIPGYTWI